MDNEIIKNDELIEKLEGLKDYLKEDKYTKQIDDLLDDVIIKLAGEKKLEDIEIDYRLNNNSISYDK